MDNRLSVYSSALLLVAAMGASLPADAQMYRYTDAQGQVVISNTCLLYTSPSPRD